VTGALEEVFAAFEEDDSLTFGGQVAGDHGAEKTPTDDGGVGSLVSGGRHGSFAFN
jgi:hypothetical protein